ncbi:MAG: DivIVA domain-containing protein [Actinomycetota bacterium]
MEKEAVELAIGPMDIHHKEFSTVRVGGYNKEEVDAFLDMVADELDRLLHRNQEQAELIESMREKVAQFDSMQQTLQNAIINAQKSADNIVQEAKMQAEAQLREAQERSLHILEEAKAERERILQSFAGIREQVMLYVATIKELLDRNLTLIRDYEARLTAAEVREAPPSPTPAATVAATAVTSELGAPTVVPEVGPARVASPATPHPAAPPVTEPPAQVETGEKGLPGRGERPEPTIAPPAREPEMIPETRVEAQPRPAVTPEQEMEILERSLRKEAEQEPEFTRPERPVREEKEKHFFWE